MTQSFVYFIRPVGMVGPIKIGCSRDVSARLLTLGTWSPFPLELIAKFEGGMKLERNIHECFADVHSHKEWFRASAKLLDFIAKIKAGVPVGEAIDLSTRIRPIVAIGHKKPEKPGMEGYRSYRARLRGAENRASKAVGKDLRTPAPIDAIMERWGALGNEHRKGPRRRPSEAEFASMDAVVRDPLKHCIPHSVRFKHLHAALAKKWAGRSEQVSA